MMALGKSAARVAADRVAIAIGGELARGEGDAAAGGPHRPDPRGDGGRRATPSPIDLGLGRGEDSVWTSDLSEEYVRINAKYTT